MAVLAAPALPCDGDRVETWAEARRATLSLSVTRASVPGRGWRWLSMANLLIALTPTPDQQ